MAFPAPGSLAGLLALAMVSGCFDATPPVRLTYNRSADRSAAWLPDGSTPDDAAVMAMAESAYQGHPEEIPYESPSYRAFADADGNGYETLLSRSLRTVLPGCFGSEWSCCSEPDLLSVAPC